MTRKQIGNLPLIWLGLGLGFWLVWVIAAPAYDSGLVGGGIFLGAYTLGIPFLLGTVLMESLVGTPLGIGHHVLAIVLGALPLLYTHRRFRSMRTERTGQPTP